MSAALWISVSAESNSCVKMLPRVKLYGLNVLLCLSAFHWNVSQALTWLEDEFYSTYAEVKSNGEDFQDYEVVIPLQVNEEDNLVLESATPFLTNRRQKREIQRDVKHFSLRGFNEHFHLELSPTTNLLAPGFKVYHRDGSKTQHKDSDNAADCLYSGRLKTHSNSAAAVNLCGGMSGLIKTDGAEYLIQPLRVDASNANLSAIPHLLQKRSPRATQHVTRKKGQKKESNRQTHFCGRKRRYMPHKPHRKHFWLPDEFPGEKRVKRSMENGGRRFREAERHGRRRNVETLVVADREMVRKHGTENVTTYVLTVFNMVAMLYQDATIGNNVSVVLVGLVLLEGDEPGLSLSHNAEHSLSSFCQWQSTIHTSKGTQHDHAVLVTGLDICSWKDEPCDTLGYAPISGMCSKYRSCTVNEDSGLALAFTVAHEVGHNFGMVHDGQGSPCKHSRGTIMSPSLSGLDTALLWSVCSRRDLAKFLESPRAICLKNEPDSPDELQFPNTLPGQMYDADMQCKLQFGSRSRLCEHYPRKNEVCKALWCQRSGRECETKFLPAAEGTPCGENKWCRRGHCVDQEAESPEPVDGGWGPYSEWSNCSRRCGGGVMHREKLCNSPSPSNGGNYCKGENKEYQLCGTEICRPDDPDFKYDQCATFNKRTIKGKRYQWRPYGKDLGALSRCRIYCVPGKEDLYLVLSTKLVDGTSCLGNFSGVCIDGECRTVGCDAKIESSVVPDRCGICGGDNSTCQAVTGSFNAVNLSAGYHEVVRIPHGSRHIHVTEASESPSYLALRSPENRYYISGQWTVDWPGRYSAAGTAISYRRWAGQPESLMSRGPTTEDLVVEVLVQEGQESTINYEFVVAVQQPEWRIVNSSCSATCGEGVFISVAKCFDQSKKVVEDSKCSASPRPEKRTLPCFTSVCPARWTVGEWSPCRADPCEPGWQHRETRCESDGKEVLKHLCKEIERPNQSQQCEKKDCHPSWETGPWSECRGQCPNGFQTRAVTCRKSINNDDDVCNDTLRPPVIRNCKNDCPFSQRIRGAWVAGPWSKCNASCGRGEKIRNVTCVAVNQSPPETPNQVTCNPAHRPAVTLSCSGINCSTTVDSKECRDNHSWCASVTNEKACMHKFYAKKCCESCRSLL